MQDDGQGETTPNFLVDPPREKWCWHQRPGRAGSVRWSRRRGLAAVGVVGSGGWTEVVASGRGAVASADPFGPYLARVHRRLLEQPAVPGWREVDATLVFADVSGFTPLTERLAKRGKIGAEELTDVLNDVFGTLLAHADDFGGDLLKFGGDALLLLFEGDDHAQRACGAALAMQAALRPFSRLSTAGGRVALRMSVGVNSGPVLLYLVGRSHRELLVSGPTMSRLVELEAAADATEVLVGPSTAAAIDARWLSGEQKDGGCLLRPAVRVLPDGRGNPAAGADGAGDPDTGARGIPAGLRSHLLSRRDTGEHRVAVLTFLQFKGVDALFEREGPARVHAALDRLVVATQEACEHHGVTFLATDLDKDGGKILLVAGAPLASEDDVDRTLAAVLDILDAAPPQLQVRAGVNGGRAFAVDVGSATRRTYAVMGDSTNLAARVMGKAEPGRLVATAGAMERARRRYRIEPLEPFLVKGKSVPVLASTVRRASAAPSRADAAGPLLGRDNEREVLLGILGSTRDGRGGVVHLVAEPGMGKSRLVAEFLGAARGMTRIAFEGAHYAASSPYLVLRGPLRKLFTGLDVEVDDELVLRTAVQVFAPHLARHLPLLAVLFGLDLPATEATAAIDPSFRRAALQAAAVELIAAAISGPGAIVIEDAHWLDDASADLLSALIGSDEHRRRWAVAVTSRDVTAGGLRVPPDTTRVFLTAIAGDQLRSLLDHEVATGVPPAVFDDLVRRSGGNPLFLLELLAAVKRGDTVGELPDTVEALIAARIDTLSESDRRLLRIAAVLGARFDPDVLGEVAGQDPTEVEAALGRLEGFLEHGGDGYRFQHALVREAAYEGLPYRDRRKFHLRAGTTLEARPGLDADEWSDVLSLHFTRAGDLSRSLRYSRMAADRARRAFAPAEGLAFYERSVAAAQGLGCEKEQIGDLLEMLGECAEQAGRYGVASDAFRRARQAVGHLPLRVVELHRKEGWVRERSGRYADALRWYSRGRRLLDDVVEEGLRPEDGGREVDIERLRAQLALGAGAARLRQGRYTACLPLLEEAVARAGPIADRPTLAHAYYLLDWAHTDLGNEERHLYRELSLPIYEELGDMVRQGVVASNLGIDAYFEGRWDEATSWYSMGRSASERAGDVVQMATATNNLGEVESDRGRLVEASALFREAMRVWQAAPFPVGVALATSNLGRVEVRAGRLDEGRRLLADARARFRSIGAESYVLEVDAREAERLVYAGEAAAALALIEDVTTRSQRAGGLSLLMLMVDRMGGYALAQLGRVEEAARRFADVLERAGAAEARYELALTLHAQSHLAAFLGKADGCAAARSAATFASLGIESPPRSPLPG